LFEVEQGDDLASLKAAYHLDGPQGDIAREILDEAPTLTPYETMFYRIFGDLATMRNNTAMGTGPISWDKIVAYARYHEFNRTDTDILIRVIRNMDSAFLNAIRPQASDNK